MSFTSWVVHHWRCKWDGADKAFIAFIAVFICLLAAGIVSDIIGAIR